MLRDKRISLIIPCRNEEDSLRRLLPKIPRFIDEVIVIDNNSSDQTFRIAKKFGAKALKENRTRNGIGYGFAHQTGIAAATGDYLIAMDGDGSYPLTRIKNILTAMEQKKLDFVACERFPLSAWHDMSPVRQLGSHLLTFSFNFLFGQNLADILTGMWVLRRESITFLDLTPGDWNFSLSIKGSAALNSRLHFAKMHIPYHDRHWGSSKQALLRTGLSHLLFLFNWRLQSWLTISPSPEIRLANP